MLADMKRDAGRIENGNSPAGSHLAQVAPPPAANHLSGRAPDLMAAQKGKIVTSRHGDCTLVQGLPALASRPLRCRQTLNQNEDQDPGAWSYRIVLTNRSPLLSI